MTSTAEKIATLWPEIVLLLGAVSCLVTGLHPSATARRWTPGVAALSLLIAIVLSVVVSAGPQSMGFDGLTTWVRVLGYSLGLGLLGVSVGLPDRAERHASEPALGADPSGFNPGRSVKGEYYAFFLLSLSGLGMVAASSDLVWLFLALELVSLPTYVMIATARPTARAHEASIKYFFLGALSAAVFLYGFALLYGATGFTDLGAIRMAFDGTGPTPLMLAGLALAVVGLCFKTACFPMHGYAADVYEGAPTAVTAFLAVVPKAAGFVGLILVLGTVGWPLPVPVVVLLSVIAIVTMTVGNLLALVQTRLKRVMAYSSVAHSGYLMLGLIAGPAVVSGAAAVGTLPGEDGLYSVAGSGNGLAGLLFYLLSYALATVTAMAVIGLLRTPGDASASPAADGDQAEDAESSPGYEDLAGLRHRHPVLGLALLLSMLSLMGVPPLIGFVGKLVLALPVLEMGLWPLVVALVLNSAISAVYYLRIAVAAFGGRRADEAADGTAGAPLLYAPFRGGVAIAAAAGLLVGGTLAAAWAFDSADAAFDARSRPAEVTAAAAPEPDEG